MYAGDTLTGSRAVLGGIFLVEYGFVLWGLSKEGFSGLACYETDLYWTIQRH
jgi:hypothetical protein